MERFTVVDDGTLDYVLRCNDCGSVLRFNTDSLGDAIAIADSDHGYWDCEDAKADNESDMRSFEVAAFKSDAFDSMSDSIHGELQSFFIN